MIKNLINRSDRNSIHGGKSWQADARFLEIVTALKMQSERLNRTSQRMISRGKELFDQCVRAQQEGDVGRATIYANEIAQLRKMSKVIVRSQLSLEKVLLRLETVKEFGDVMYVLGPATTIIKQIQSDLSGIVPEVAHNLKHIDEVLEGLIIEAGSISGAMGASVAVSDAEAHKILQEAAEIATQRMKTTFPEIPESVGTTESSFSKSG
ncbi:MAG: Snf7 family protein [Aigarchaeota archaeon]|nr:Snf7 family protein [Aigarchaeota archaeon]MDW8092137.1 Snf7 family protein [Nitrososphaerota archaeon]